MALVQRACGWIPRPKVQEARTNSRLPSPEDRQGEDGRPPTQTFNNPTTGAGENQKGTNPNLLSSPTVTRFLFHHLTVVIEKHLPLSL